MANILTFNHRGVFIQDHYQKLQHIWKYFSHKDPRLFKFEETGKWVIHRTPNELERISFDILLSHVANGEIECMKYRPIPNDLSGPFSKIQPPLCVYANESSKQSTNWILLAHNFKDIYWQSNEDTRLIQEEITKAKGRINVVNGKIIR